MVNNMRIRNLSSISHLNFWEFRIRLTAHGKSQRPIRFWYEIVLVYLLHSLALTVRLTTGQNQVMSCVWLQYLSASGKLQSAIEDNKDAKAMMEELGQVETAGLIFIEVNLWRDKTVWNMGWWKMKSLHQKKKQVYIVLIECVSKFCWINRV